MVMAKPKPMESIVKGSEVLVSFYGTIDSENDDGTFDVRTEDGAIIGNMPRSIMKIAPEGSIDMMSLLSSKTKVELEIHWHDVLCFLPIQRRVHHVIS
jgi:hypothetical protein